MITVKFDSQQVESALARIPRSIPYATKNAINATALLVKQGLVEEMRRVFDRPTPYTLNSLFMKAAKTSDLQAMVWLKDEASGAVPAVRYLGPEIFGGARSAKSTEELLRDKGILGSGLFAVPGQDAEANGMLDRYGNLKTGIIAQLRSGLGIERELGRQANITDKSKKRNKKRSLYYVLGKDNPVGIARRSPASAGGGSGFPESVLWFVRSPNYEQRFKFFDVAQKIVDENLVKETAKAIQHDIDEATKRGKL